MSAWRQVESLNSYPRNFGAEKHTHTSQIGVTNAEIQCAIRPRILHLQATTIWREHAALLVGEGVGVAFT